MLIISLLKSSGSAVITGTALSWVSLLYLCKIFTWCATCKRNTGYNSMGLFFLFILMDGYMSGNIIVCYDVK